MKTHPKIPLRYIIAATLVVTVMMVGSAVIELLQSRNELLHVLQEHSLSLIETIERSSVNVVLSTEQVEHELADRLLNNAFYIARLDSEGRLSQRDLYRFCGANGIYRINIVDGRGNRVLGSHPQLPAHLRLPEKNNPREILRPILSGETDRLVIGLKQARFEEGQRYAVAVRRTRPGGGAIVLNLDAGSFLEFRRNIGIGKLVKDFSDNTGIDYVVLQDKEGILAATDRVKEISSVEQDSLLLAALDRDSTIMRQVSFNGHETYEVAKRLAIEGSPVGLLRIGLSLDELRSTQQRISRRIIIMTIVLVVIGALVFTAIVINQNYRLVARQYADIRSFTGNILDNMQDAVVAVDSQDHITIFNRQAEGLFACTALDILGKRPQELPGPPGRCLPLIFSASAPELTLECAPDKIRTVSVSLSGTRRPDGTVESRTAVIKDMTEARRMERDIQRQEKLTAMGRLASGVAHEVRNPLNAISMIAQRYEREFRPRNGLKEYRALTEVLQNETARVNRIVQQFLRFARPPQLRLSESPAIRLLNHVSTLFESQANAKGVRFRSHCGFDGSILIDMDLMTQALLNLLQNGLDATSPGGHITLNILGGADSVVLETVDSGSGIPPEEQERIFDLYFTTKPDGSGMGLAITQQIISQHRGTIAVSSTPGKGSTFSIRIPKQVP